MGHVGTLVAARRLGTSRVVGWLVGSLFLCIWLAAAASADSQQTAASAAANEDTDAPTRPNIVLILCDDLGYGDLQCYGHPHIRTPNLDRLAAQGIRCTDFYSAAPVCSPSRVGLLTGRSPNRAGVYDWIPSSDGKPRADARDQVHMRATETTIAQLLRSAGYDTCLSGKWHCNSRFNDAAQPQPGDAGFDHWFATQNNAAPTHRNPDNFVRNGQPAGSQSGYSCQLVTDEAIRWLDQRRAAKATAARPVAGDAGKPTESNSDTTPDTSAEKPADNLSAVEAVDAESRPFFLMLAFHEPHEPVASPPELAEQYKDATETDQQAEYFANVANVDQAVGRLIEALRERKMLDETLIVFTSDNGPETLHRHRRAKNSYGSPGPLRGMKLHTHEAGFRVPGIFHWPGKIASGRVVSTPVSALDLLPTFCHLANLPAPTQRSLDGVNLAPLLADDGQLERSKPLLWCYFNATNEARVAMRAGKWKVLAQLNGGKFPKVSNITTERAEALAKVQLTDFEIYDLESDLAEATNLVNQDSEEVRELQKQMTAGFHELIRDSHVWTTEPPAP